MCSRFCDFIFRSQLHTKSEASLETRFLQKRKQKQKPRVYVRSVMHLMPRLYIQISNDYHLYSCNTLSHAEEKAINGK